MWSRKVSAIAIGVMLSSSAFGQSLLFRADGKAQGDRYAESVGIVGDFNRDGYDDWVVGGKFDDSAGSNAGIARVYSGKDAAVLFSVTGGVDDWMGLAVAGAGDVNRDGYDDVIIGAPGVDANGTNSGKAYVYSGKTGGLIWSFKAGAAFDHFGTAVGGAIDADGDGYSDVIVGAPQEGNGTVRVYSGKTGAIIWTWTGIAASDGFGDVVNSAGDVNGDGFDDVIVGAPFGDPNGASSGYARVFSGRTGNLIWSFNGAAAGYQFGAAVDGAGDYNDDGFADLIVGSPYHGGGGADSGRVYIYSGVNGSLWGTYTGVAGALQGFAVAGAGDVNGSGAPAVLIGAPGENGGTLRVYNRFGLVYTPLNGVTEYAAAVAGGGDLNRDGKNDFVIGDPGRNVAGSDTGRAYAYMSTAWWASRSVYGNGWPGTHGVPDLTASADPVLCATITLNVENSRGSTTAGVIFLGLSAASVPTALGGTLLLVPHTVIPITIPGNGLALPLPVLCDSALAGLAIYHQVLESDPGATQGVSFTPGLQLILGGTSPY